MCAKELRVSLVKLSEEDIATLKYSPKSDSKDSLSMQRLKKKGPKRLDSAFCKPSPRWQRKRTETKKFQSRLDVLHNATITSIQDNTVADEESPQEKKGEQYANDSLADHNAPYEDAMFNNGLCITRIIGW